MYSRMARHIAERYRGLKPDQKVCTLHKVYQNVGSEYSWALSHHT